MPCDGAALMKVSPGGSLSVTATFVPAPGPALFKFNVKVTFCPTFGVGLSMVLVSDRSATCGVIVTLLWSSSVAMPLLGVESGSRWSEAEIWAVLVTATEVPTEAVICRLALAPPASVPTVHTPVPLSYTPAGVALTNVRPWGSWSVTLTFVAELGPALFTFNVNVTGWPSVTVGLLIVLISERSASWGVSVMLL